MRGGVNACKTICYKIILIFVLAAALPSVAYSDEPRKTIFAVKTNLLYDLATAANIELELPVSNRVSIMAEQMFPWWNLGKSNTLKILSTSLEGRYWFGNRENRQRLNGWFLGAYGAYGKYDLCYNDKGVDGSNLYSMGLSTGYAHRISSHLGLEYSLALGYLYTEYYDYDKVHGTKYGDIKAVSYPWQVEHSSWIGPTKLKVSLVWYLQTKGKGAKR